MPPLWIVYSVCAVVRPREHQVAFFGADPVSPTAINDDCQSLLSRYCL